MPHPRVTATFLVLTAAAPLDAQQQPVVLRAPEFEIGVRGRGVRSAVSRQGHFEEWLGIRLRGSIVDPRFVGFSITLQPRLMQSRLGEVPEPTGSNGTWLGLDAQLDVLPGRPLSATLRAARYALDQTGYGLYGDLATRNTFAEAAVRYDNHLMPLQLRLASETWGQPLRGDPDAAAPPTSIETIHLGGGNRKTTFTLQQNTSRNGAEFRLRLAEFLNRQTWGKGSSFQLSASAVGQSGSASAEGRQTQIAGVVHLQHLGSVWSDWSASRQTSSSDLFNSSGETYTGGLGWQMIPGLAVGVNGLLGTLRAAGLSDRQVRVGPNATLNLRLPLASSLSLSGGVAYQRFSGSVAEGAVFAVVGEPHALDQAGTFLLDYPGVEEASLVVRSPGGTVFLVGVDYELSTDGGYVRVAALPAGRLEPGRRVLTDYRYRPTDIPDATALWSNYAGELQVRWFRLYHRRWHIDPSGEPAFGGFADRTIYQDYKTTGVRLMIPLGRLSITGGAERQDRRNEGYAITASSVSGGLNARLTARTRFGLGADYLHTASTTGIVKRTGGRSQLDWYPHSTLRLGATFSGWRSTENLTMRRLRLGGSAQAAWQPGLFRAAVYYTYQDWQDRSLVTNAATGQPVHFLVVELGRRF